jgi:hypothetical protein
MSPRPWIAFALALLVSWPAFADPAPPPPDLDCRMGLAALQNWASWIPGAQRTTVDGHDVIAMADPEVWRVEITFTQPGQIAHPAVILRKFVKQVTGVWTAQSKACGYGNQAEFADLLNDMKATDKRLTDASRAEAEQHKREQSPLGGP